MTARTGQQPEMRRLADKYDVICSAVFREGNEMVVHASTQDPTEVQHIVARVLGVPDAFVTVETRRMGGAFGG